MKEPDPGQDLQKDRLTWQNRMDKDAAQAYETVCCDELFRISRRQF